MRKNKIRKKEIESKRRKGKWKGIMTISLYYPPEKLFSKCFSKRFQIRQRIYSTSTFQTGAATTTAISMPNAALITSGYRSPVV
jgi:hypothetical protein